MDKNKPDGEGNHPVRDAATRGREVSQSYFGTDLSEGAVATTQLLEVFAFAAQF